MDKLQNLVTELHDVVTSSLTLHVVESVESFIKDVKTKIEELENALTEHKTALSEVSDAPAPVSTEVFSDQISQPSPEVVDGASATGQETLKTE